MSTGKREVLIIIPSGGDLPLAEPSGASVSVGFYLVELAQVLRQFESTHQFTFATPDGTVPQLDINGMALPYHALDALVATAQQARELQSSPTFDVVDYRERFAPLVARREQELGLLERHLGRLALSDVLPGTDKDAATLHPELAARMSRLPEHSFLSARQIVQRHRDPLDSFEVGRFDFIHAPGGHAPMISFRDDPWLGEILHLARDNGVLISLICHAPVILTSTQFRIDESGNPYTPQPNPFAGTTVSTVPKLAERSAEDYGYLHVPGEQTRVTYYIDEALEAIGVHNLPKENPAAIEVHHERAVNVVSTNGPQGVDALAQEIESLLAATGAPRATSTT
ncbi:putative intracellular protease/amidase [Kibdelosporangium banguiense]|uniref:Intracellular protease/amidase n=1 Tax=Kibdelosporangium banguiense TaxID=1365924 RepID=A0ABS4TWR0_9PSEU|nr:hypothetical protein [Kibdelosporangium banguiense]MBP2328840.1 putative intracellular protease/amidase [Kibdelosporangium banguiense]